MPEPDFRSIDLVPMRALTGRQQKMDRRSAGPDTVPVPGLDLGPPRLLIPTAFRMRGELERFTNHPGSVVQTVFIS